MCAKPSTILSRLLKHSPDVKENHILEADLPDNPILIAADSTQFKQIFWNLARNAIQAMEKGGTFSIKLRTIERSSAFVSYLRTPAAECPPEQVEQLFEPFSISTTGGTGLGFIYRLSNRPRP